MNVRSYVYIWIYVCIHTYVYAHMAYMRICKEVSSKSNFKLIVCICMQTCVYACAYVYKCKDMYVYTQVRTYFTLGEKIQPQ